MKVLKKDSTQPVAKTYARITGPQERLETAGTARNATDMILDVTDPDKVAPYEAAPLDETALKKQLAKKYAPTEADVEKGLDWAAVDEGNGEGDEMGR